MIDHRSIDPVNAYFSRIERVDSGQTLDQCRFPGTIFSHQCHDLALPQCKIHIVQCLYTRKCHGNPPHGQYHIMLHFTPPFP